MYLVDPYNQYTSYDFACENERNCIVRQVPERYILLVMLLSIKSGPFEQNLLYL